MTTRSGSLRLTCGDDNAPYARSRILCGTSQPGHPNYFSCRLDGALRSLRQQAVGPWLLTAVALGIAAYGVYSLARSRHARV